MQKMQHPAEAITLRQGQGRGRGNTKVLLPRSILDTCASKHTSIRIMMMINIKKQVGGRRQVDSTILYVGGVRVLLLAGGGANKAEGRAWGQMRGRHL